MSDDTRRDELGTLLGKLRGDEKAEGVLLTDQEWADRVLALLEPPEPEPCDEEVYSWDVFRHGQVDPYWIRCTRTGPHDEHEDSNTGATWKATP